MAAELVKRYIEIEATAKNVTVCDTSYRSVSAKLLVLFKSLVNTSTMTQRW